MASDAKHTNRLAKETSPYLLQHQHNPVDWYAWGPEAFDAARSQKKPIFLSVGYSTCYWCHVMERQCFEVEAIAQVMNDLFINIKVDREERPDVDQLYMTAVQVLTRHGGWPMSVFLLPDLRPFYGGTYFPPEDAHGRPGFVTVLRAIEDAFQNRLGEVGKSAEQIVGILQQMAEPLKALQKISVGWGMLDSLVERSAGDHDPVHGGYGSAPKFPRETLLEMLLTYLQLRSTSDDASSAVQNMLTSALDSMANGGIRDHLGGGFHRYSTDREWLVPHFEIMLYDNAMLGWIYTQASVQFNEKRYASVARETFDFVLRQMTSPDGAFYTAFDAEVDAMEGLSYLWTLGEIRDILTSEPGKGMGTEFDDADVDRFAAIYGLDRGPNFADPHHGNGRPDKNILYLPNGPDGEDDPIIARMRMRLYDARLKRKQPLLDTKIITSWNALMIRAYSHAGKILNEPRYIEAAKKAATFLLSQHRRADGSLYRTSRDGVKKYDAFLDDYAFLAQALIELSNATGEANWRRDADALARVMLAKFGGEKAGGFYFTAASADDLIVRQMVATDSPLPSGNGVAAMVMDALGMTDVSRATIANFAAQLEQQAEGMSTMLQAAMMSVQKHGPIIVDPGKQSEADRPLSPTELAQRIVGAGIAWHDPIIMEVKLQILNPFHINANQASPGMIPTKLSVIGAEVLTIEYPEGNDVRYGDQSIRAYSGQVSVMVQLARPSEEPIRIILHYQACDDSSCLPEVRKEFTVTVPSPRT